MKTETRNARLANILRAAAVQTWSMFGMEIILTKAEDVPSSLRFSAWLIPTVGMPFEIEMGHDGDDVIANAAEWSLGMFERDMEEGLSILVDALQRNGGRDILWTTFHDVMLDRAHSTWSPTSADAVRFLDELVDYGVAIRHDLRQNVRTYSLNLAEVEINIRKR